MTDTRISFEGVLEKAAAGIFKSKTIVWMVLRDTSLEYYKTDRRSSCIGSIEMSEVQSVRQLLGQKGGCQFEIVTKAKTYIFGAEEVKMCTVWVKMLQEAMVLQQAENTDRNPPTSNRQTAVCNSIGSDVSDSLPYQTGSTKSRQQSSTSAIYSEPEEPQSPSSGKTIFGVSLRSRTSSDRRLKLSSSTTSDNTSKPKQTPSSVSVVSKSENQTISENQSTHSHGSDMGVIGEDSMQTCRGLDNDTQIRRHTFQRQSNSGVQNKHEVLEPDGEYAPIDDLKSKPDSPTQIQKESELLAVDNDVFYEEIPEGEPSRSAPESQNIDELNNVSNDDTISVSRQSNAIYEKGESIKGLCESKAETVETRCDLDEETYDEGESAKTSRNTTKDNSEDGAREQQHSTVNSSTVTSGDSSSTEAPPVLMRRHSEHLYSDPENLDENVVVMRKSSRNTDRGFTTTVTEQSDNGTSKNPYRSKLLHQDSSVDTDEGFKDLEEVYDTVFSDPDQEQKDSTAKSQSVSKLIKLEAVIDDDTVEGQACTKLKMFLQHLDLNGVSRTDKVDSASDPIAELRNLLQAME